MSDAILRAIESHGVLAVFILVLIEGTGVPLPSELTMAVAGALAGGALGGHSDLTLGNAIATGVIANVSGAMVAYTIAATVGTGVLLGPGRHLGFKEEDLARVHAMFARHGWVLVMVGRCIPFVRGLISYPAGVAHMGWIRYGVFTTLGCIPFVVSMTWIGYVVGANYETFVGPVGTVGVVVGAVAVAVAVGWRVRVVVQHRAATRRSRALVDAVPLPPPVVETERA